MNELGPRQAQQASDVDHGIRQRPQLISYPATGSLATGNDGEPPGPPSPHTHGDCPGC